MLWECSTCRDNFQEALKQLLGAEFGRLSTVKKTLYVLGNENWEDHFDALLHLVKEFIVAIWEVQKQKLMTHTLVNFSVSPRPEIRVLLLELGVGLVSRVSLVSHVVRVRAMLCMLV